MKPLAFFLAAVALLVGVATCARGNAGPRKLTILYSADIAGFIEPCGCSKLQRGGLQRAAVAVAAARAQGPTVLVDGGDALFKESRPRGEGDALRARAIAGILAGLGLDAAGVGERDLGVQEPARAPPEALLDLGLGQGKPWRLVERGGVRLMLVGSGKDAGEAAARVRQVRSQADVVAVLWHAGGWEGAVAAQSGLAEAGADLVLVSHADALVGAGKDRALTSGPVPLFAVEGHGQSLLRLDIALPRGAKPPLVFLGGEDERALELKNIDDRIAAYRERIEAEPVGPTAELLKEKLQELAARRGQMANAPPPSAPPDKGALAYSFIPLPLSAPEDPKVKEEVEAYQAAAAQLALRAAAADPEVCPAPAGGDVFVGGERCAECHEEADAFWKGTRHHQALLTLIALKRQHNADCIGCHVTAWKLPGGACRIDKVGRFANVQCEACHGAGSRHAENPEVPLPAAVPRERCIGCHDPHNSPEFDYEAYKKQILGPGHGMPARPKESSSDGPFR